MIRALLSFFALLALAATASGQADALGGGGGSGSPFGGSNPFGSFGADEAEVTLAVEASQTTVAPGGRLVIAVTLSHADGFHSWPSAEQDVLPDGFDFAILTEANPSWSDDAPFVAGTTQWPEPHAALVADPAGGSEPVEVLAYDGAATIFVPITIAEGAATGSYDVSLDIAYQACNDTFCLAPEFVTETVSIEVAEGAGETELAGVFAGFDVANFQGALAPEGSDPVARSGDDAPPAAGSTRQFFGIDIGGGMVVLALAAAVGGFVLNLTPCVLPVIPIKIMTISQHAGSPGRSWYLGLWMAAGVIAFWLGLGIPVAFVSGFVDPSQIFGIWWVTAGIGAVIVLMALGLMGMFQITLPQRVYMVNPKADNAQGSFLFGVMTAVLGLPCFGFVAGALLAGAATMPWYQVLAIFFFLGVGMALPYLVLSAKPSWVEKIPRTGPASELVKQVLGLLLVAAGAYFIGSGLIGLVSEQPWMGRQLHWWAVALFVLLAGGWLVYRTFQISRKPAPRLVFTVLSLSISAAIFVYVSDQTASAKESYLERQEAVQAAAESGELLTTTWIEYTPALHERALEEGYTVVLDFTAEWCLNCKALKAAVLNKEPVKSRLREDSVVSMTVDLTSRSAPGWTLLRDELGQTGIPLLVVEREGAERWMSNAYTAGQVLSALDRAQPERTAAR